MPDSVTGSNISFPFLSTYFTVYVVVVFSDHLAYTVTFPVTGASKSASSVKFKSVYHPSNV